MAAISLGVALAVGAAASAAGGATKAVIASKAAKKAGKQQVQGTQEANRYMQQGMGRLDQLYAPYLNSGAGAMGTLGRLTTPGPGARYASPGPKPALPPGNYGPPQAVGRPGGMQMPDGRPVQGPYPMAEGGDMMVDRPTLFLAGEAGPERAQFQPQQRPGAPPPMQGGAMGGNYQLGGGQMRPSTPWGGAGRGPGELSQRLLQKSYAEKGLPGAMFGGRPGAPPMRPGGPPMQGGVGAPQFGGGPPQMSGGMGRPPMPQFTPQGRPPMGGPPPMMAAPWQQMAGSFGQMGVPVASGPPGMEQAFGGGPDEQARLRAMAAGFQG
jgi:hypothetical protein